MDHWRKPRNDFAPGGVKMFRTCETSLR